MAIIPVTTVNETNVKTAIETTAQDGDTVLIDPGTVTITATPLRIQNKAIRIVNRSGNPRDLVITGTNGIPIFQLTNNAVGGAQMNRQSFEAITLAGNGATSAGISWAGTAGQQGFRFLQVKNCTFGGGFSGQGISLVGGGTGSDCLFHPLIEDCEITGIGTGQPGGRGIVITNSTLLRMIGNEINACGLSGALLSTCAQASLINNSIEGNNTTPTLQGQTHEGNAQLVLQYCHSFSILGADFEGLNAIDSDDPRLIKTALALKGCWGGEIAGMGVSYAIPQGARAAGTYAIAYLAGTRGVRRGTVNTSYLPDNPFFYDRFSPRDAQGFEGQWLNFTRDLASQGLQT